MTKPLSRDEINVAWRTQPFTGAVRRRGIAVRADERWPTILEIVSTTDDLPAHFMAFGEVRINDHVVDRKFWHCVRPHLSPMRPVAITLHMPMRGGGAQGGQKNIVATVSSIAVLLVAAAVSGGALGLGAIGFLGAGAVNAAAGAAVGIGGALLVHALSPPPKLAAQDSGSAAITDNDGKAASLTGNVLAAGTSVPRVIGTRRAFPPLGCPPLNELVGTVEQVEAVYVLAGPHALSDVRFGNVAAADMPDVDIELQEGLPDSPQQSLVSRYGKTIALQLEMSRHKTDPTTQFRLVNQSSPDLSSPQWHTFVTRKEPDEVWLRLVFPEGLFRDSAPTSATNIAFRVRFRQRGSSTWINGPEIHFSCNKPGAFQKDIRLKWGTIPAAPNTPATNQAPVYAYKSVPGQDGVSVTPATAGWTADSYFSAGAGNDLLSNATLATSKVRNVELFDDKAIIWLDPNTFPQDTYEIGLIRSSPYLSSAFTAATYNVAPESDRGSSPSIVDFFLYHLASGFYEIPVDQATLHDRVVVTTIASVWNTNPIQAPGDFATVSVRGHGLALDQMSVLASGYVNDWDGSGWTNLTRTSNPAPHFRDVLVGRLSPDPMPEDMVADSELVDWRDYCDDQNLTCDLIVDGRNGDDVLKAIAAAGRARPRMTESWGVAVNKDVSAEAPVQIFSPRNMRGFGFSKELPLPTTGFRVRFDDADNDYIEDQVIVDDPDAPPTASARYEDLRLDAIVESAGATIEALFQLKQARTQLATIYQGEVPADGLVCFKGDLVGVQHDVIDGQAGFARIREIVRSAPNVTGLVLDGTIPVPTEDAWVDPDAAWASYSDAWALPRTGVAIRLKDGSSIIKEVSGMPDETTEIDFVTPFTDPGSSLDEDCLVVAGPLGSEYSRMRVLDIAPGADLTARVAFVNEAPELFE